MRPRPTSASSTTPCGGATVPVSPTSEYIERSGGVERPVMSVFRSAAMSESRDDACWLVAWVGGILLALLLLLTSAKEGVVGGAVGFLADEVFGHGLLWCAGDDDDGDEGECIGEN